MVSKDNIIGLHCPKGWRMGLNGTVLSFCFFLKETTKVGRRAVHIMKMPFV